MAFPNFEELRFKLNEDDEQVKSRRGVLNNLSYLKQFNILIDRELALDVVEDFIKIGAGAFGEGSE